MPAGAGLRAVRLLLPAPSWATRARGHASLGSVCSYCTAPSAEGA